jgi:hypothetical protein
VEGALRDPVVDRALTITLHKETGGDETEGMKKLRDAFGRARDPTAGEEEQLPKHPAPVWAAVDL